MGSLSKNTTIGHIARVSTLLLLAACSKDSEIKQSLATEVELARFMGLWYVHGYTPTAIDKDAWNAIEQYELRSDGRIQTTYSFNKGGPQGKRKVFKPIAKVINTETNAEWRMRFFGVITAHYYIVYISPDYQYAVIGHPNRKYAWIMSRDSAISADQYAFLLNELRVRTYETDRIKRVSHTQGEATAL